MKHNFLTLICAGAIGALGFNALGQTDIYNSTSAGDGSAYQLSNGKEFGNELQLIGPQAYDWTLQNFVVDYYIPSATALNNIGIDVSLYGNQGGLDINGNATPGPLLWTSGFYYGSAYLSTGYASDVGGVVQYNSVVYADDDTFIPGSKQTVNGDLPTGGIFLPTSFTFTVTFTNLNTQNTVYVPLANTIQNQTVANFGISWSKQAGQWVSLTNSDSPLNMMADLSGVPEPSVFYLGALGSALLFGARRFKRKS
jgi:hypothetical protein